MDTHTNTIGHDNTPISKNLEHIYVIFYLGYLNLTKRYSI